MNVAMSAISSDSGLIILGLVGLLGNTIAVVVGAYLTARNSTRAQKEALEARLAVLRAEEMGSIAQKDASESVAKIVRGLVRVEKVASDTNKVASDTHTIVNSQRTIMLRALYVLASRISKENPADDDARLAMEKAESDLHDAEIIEVYLKGKVGTARAVSPDFFEG